MVILRIQMMIDKKTTHHVTYNAIYANPIQHYIPKNTHTMEQKSFPNKKKKKKTKNKKQKSKAIFVTLAQTQQSMYHTYFYIFFQQHIFLYIFSSIYFQLFFSISIKHPKSISSKCSISIFQSINITGHRSNRFFIPIFKFSFPNVYKQRIL